MLTFPPHNYLTNVAVGLGSWATLKVGLMGYTESCAVNLILVLTTQRSLHKTVLLFSLYRKFSLKL